MTLETSLSVEGSSGRISYQRQGAGPPVVLLHPLALAGGIWAPVVGRLAGRYDVITPDARGHGSSEWDGNPFTIEDLADDVISLLDSLGLRQASLVGMSMGGSIAINAAGRYPDRVRKLVLADTTAWYGEGAGDTWNERADRVLDTGRGEQIPFQVDRWFTERFRQVRPEDVQRVVATFLATDSAAHAQACRAMGAMDSRELLPHITAATLAFAGEEDYATPPAMGQYAADHVQNGRALTLPGLRHLSMVQCPELADLVTAHVEGTELPPAPTQTCGCDGVAGRAAERAS
jgi:3-oxoadipate enol-lactonase